MTELLVSSGLSYEIGNGMDLQSVRLQGSPEQSERSGNGSSSPSLMPRNRPTKNGSCFDCRIFQLNVGPYRHRFMVHESALSKSPVLDRMCRGSFQESAEGLVNFPEDNADDFGCLLEYLYATDYDVDYEAPDVFDKLVNVYILAEKYQMDPLKRLTVAKLRQGFASSPESFFRTAQNIYQNTPESDKVFRSYFTATAPAVLQTLPDGQLSALLDIVDEGGALARDIFWAEREAHRLDMAKRPGPGLNDHETQVFAALKRRDVTSAGLGLDDLCHFTCLSRKEIEATFEGLYSHGLVSETKGGRWTAIGDNERIHGRWVS